MVTIVIKEGLLCFLRTVSNLRFILILHFVGCKILYLSKTAYEKNLTVSVPVSKDDLILSPSHYEECHRKGGRTGAAVKLQIVSV